MADNLPIIVAEWPRNSRELVRVTLDEFRGRPTIDVRTWYRDGNEIKPGRAGITLSVSHLAALSDALTAAHKRAKIIGLIEADTDAG